jgi:hypothetical protein
MLDNPLGAHANGQSRPKADCIVCSDLDGVVIQFDAF